MSLIESAIGCTIFPATKSKPKRNLEMRRGTLMFSVAADGGVRGRRGEADAARAAAALRQAQGRREEQEAIRASRRARIQPGK